MTKELHEIIKEIMGITYEQYYFKWAYAITGIARELERVLEREKAFEILGNAFNKMAAAGAPKVKNFEELIVLQKEVLKNPVHSRIAAVGDIIEDPPNRLVCNFTECLWESVFNKMNATDVGYIMVCHPDFPLLQTFNSKNQFDTPKDCDARLQMW